MFLSPSRLPVAALAFAALFGLSEPLVAQDGGEALVRKWMDSFATTGDLDVRYGATHYDSSRQAVIVEDFSAETKGAEASTINVAVLAVSGVSETPAGEIAAERIEAQGLTVSDSESIVTAVEAVFDQVPLKETEAGGKPAPFGVPHAIELSSVVLEGKDGEPPIPIEALHFVSDSFEGDAPTHLRVGADGVEVPVEAIEDDQQRQALRALGFEKLKVTIAGEGRTAPAAGEVSIENLTISVERLGALSIEADFGGIPSEILRGEDDAGSETTGDRLVEAATLRSFAVSFENQELVDMMLGQQAQQMGIGKDAFRTQFVAMLPQVLSAMGNPEFEAKAATAIAAFLGEPRTISMMAKPPAPVLLSELVGVILFAPQMAIPALSLDIQANQ